MEGDRRQHHRNCDLFSAMAQSLSVFWQNNRTSLETRLVHKPRTFNKPPQPALNSNARNLHETWLVFLQMGSDPGMQILDYSHNPMLVFASALVAE